MNIHRRRYRFVLNLLLLMLMGAFAACGRKMPTRSFDVGECNAFARYLMEDSVEANGVVVRTQEEYWALQAAVRNAMQPEWRNDCAFQALDFEREILVAKMVKVKGMHEGSLEHSATYSKSSNEITVRFQPILEERGSSWVKYLTSFVIEDVPDRSCKVTMVQEEPSWF
jgi:hypothetical protein